jgi:alpha-beta hydrolase superfamily lysophospholipase
LACGVSVPRPENTRTPADVGLTFETFRLRRTDDVGLEGWRIPAARPGGGAPRGTALLFHGYEASRASLLGVARAFHELGYDAVLIDFRGGGGSDGNRTTLGYREAEDVAAAVRFVRVSNSAKGWSGPLVLYGQSMGGAAILRSIASLDVGADGVILDSTFDRMLGTVRNRFALMGVPAFPAAELLVFWGGRQGGFSGFAHDPAEYARACTSPALLQYGEEDRNATPTDGRAIYERLAGPKEFVAYPGVGHVSLLAADPARWKSSVARFLDSVSVNAP